MSKLNKPQDILLELVQDGCKPTHTILAHAKSLDMCTEKYLEKFVAFALHVESWAEDCDLEIFEVLKKVENVMLSWKSLMEAKEHSGDCTNEAHMCLVCHREARFEEAKLLIKTLRDFESKEASDED